MVPRGKTCSDLGVFLALSYDSADDDIWILGVAKWPALMSSAPLGGAISSELIYSLVTLTKLSPKISVRKAGRYLSTLHIPINILLENRQPDKKTIFNFKETSTRGGGIK